MKMINNSGNPIPQRPDELRKLIKLLQKEKVTSYLEIGSRYGDSFYNIVSSLPPGSRAVAVDMVDGYWGRSDSRPALEANVAKLKEMGYNVQCFFGDSSSLSIRSLVNNCGPKFDCVFIDGDHRYEGLTLDWINYGPMGKLVAFHDIDGWDQFERRSGAIVEVPQVWNILKRHHRHVEFIGKHRGMGIGVLWK